jgi:chromate transporter
MMAVTRLSLFLAFLEIGLCGFGGVAPWARYVIVEKRKWMSGRDYAELLGIASVLPGANTLNLAVLLGDRARGVTGSLSALAGLVLMPLVILVGLAMLYDRFGELPDVRNALTGAAAATAGLVLGTAGKMIMNLRPGPVAIITVAGVFVAVGLMRIPLLLSLAVAVPASLALTVIFVRRA